MEIAIDDYKNKVNIPAEHIGTDYKVGEEATITLKGKIHSVSKDSVCIDLGSADEEPSDDDLEDMSSEEADKHMKKQFKKSSKNLVEYGEQE